MAFEYMLENYDYPADEIAMALVCGRRWRFKVRTFGKSAQKLLRFYGRHGKNKS
jgi:hypothetical protein